MSKTYTTIPNFLTLSRILLIFPIFLLLQKNLYTWAFAVSTFALCTDFFDGQIARKTNSITVFGSILDPIADKLFIFCLLYFFTAKGLLNPAYFAISSIRDLLQLLAIPILTGYKKINFNVKPKLLPKIATTFKYLIIIMLFSISIIHIKAQLFLSSMLLISSIIEIYILFRYISRFRLIYQGLHNTFE